MAAPSRTASARRTLAPLLLLAALVARGPAAHAAGPVDVLYAGSLVNLMEHAVGPAFDRASGDTFRGFAGGSQALANQVKAKLRRADVFISAAPAVDEALMGAANGDWIRWYVGFARSPLVIGYNASSRFAAALQSRPWYDVLTEPGMRIGRTDPKLDPKGALTVTLMQRAESRFGRSGLAARVLGDAERSDQILPEETLVGRLQSGELDAGFFYSTETAELHIPAIALPPDIAPEARYTVTILRDAPDAAAAERFVAFLLGPQGGPLLRAHGLDLTPAQIGGDAQAVPAPVLAEASAAR